MVPKSSALWALVVMASSAVFAQSTAPLPEEEKTLYPMDTIARFEALQAAREAAGKMGQPLEAYLIGCIVSMEDKIAANRLVPRPASGAATMQSSAADQQANVKRWAEAYAHRTGETSADVLLQRKYTLEAELNPPRTPVAAGAARPEEHDAGPDTRTNAGARPAAREPPALKRTYDEKSALTTIQTPPKVLAVTQGVLSSGAGSVLAIYKGKTPDPAAPLIYVFTMGRVTPIHGQDWRETALELVWGRQHMAGQPFSYNTQAHNGLVFEVLTFVVPPGSLAIGTAPQVEARIGGDRFELGEDFKLGVRALAKELGRDSIAAPPAGK